MASERPLPKTIMEHIYVCKKCGYTMTVEKGENRFCKNDGTKMTDTNVSKSEWDTYSDEIHQKVISQVKKTGKGVNPEDLKPKPKPQPKPETQQKTEPIVSASNLNNPAKSSNEQVKVVYGLKITEGSDGSSVVHTGNVFTAVFIIIAFVILMVVIYLFDAVNDSPDNVMYGVIAGLIIAFIVSIGGIAFGKAVSGIGLAARNTYETKMMVKKMLDRQEQKDLQSVPAETSEPKEKDNPDQKKNESVAQ